MFRALKYFGRTATGEMVSIAGVLGFALHLTLEIGRPLYLFAVPHDSIVLHSPPLPVRLAYASSARCQPCAHSGKSCASRTCGSTARSII